MNINNAITEGEKILKDKLIYTSYLDSELLLSKAIGKERKYILLNPYEKISNYEIKIFKKLIKKRSFGKPIAQLINTKYFWDSKFYLTDDVLIPRPDTELVVENALKITKFKNKLSVLDIGIGSGCILLSILKERKNFIGTGLDISKKCLNISKINATNLNLTSRFRLYKSDVDKFSIGKYDLIVSNPPYINKHSIKYLERDVANFEPKLALDGGLDGLSEIRKVIRKSSELIKKNGKFILEIGYDQKNKVLKLLKKEGFYINSTLKDIALNDRCIVITKI